jgi:glycerol-3-phosphate O-acyltransferase
MRAALDLYRATIGHALVWPAVLALGLREPREHEALFAEASSWLDLLSDEYFPVEGDARFERLERVLAHLLARGWVEETSAGALVATVTGELWLGFLRAQLHPLLEAYSAVSRVVAEAKGLGEREALLDRVRAVQKEALLVGEARYPEGACPIAAANALELLLRQGILVAQAKGERSEASLAPGPAFGALEPLRARLAAATALR